MIPIPFDAGTRVELLVHPDVVIVGTIVIRASLKMLVDCDIENGQHKTQITGPVYVPTFLAALPATPEVK